LKNLKTVLREISQSYFSLGRKSGRALRYHSLREDPEEPPRRGNPNWRGSKLQAKEKAKGDRKLNKIFGKASGYEDQRDVAVDTKEVFDNYYQKLKRKIEFSIPDELEKVIPEKRRVTEIALATFDSKEEEKNDGYSKFNGRQDLPFLNNKNLFRKPRDFEHIKMLNTNIHNFPKALPTLVNPQTQLEKLDELRKKLEEAPIKKTEKKVHKKTLDHMTRGSKAQALAQHASNSHANTYINCDLRYFNFDFLVDKLGYFDGIIKLFGLVKINFLK